MKRRFSRRELFILRNYIPIDQLIDRDLMIPSKVSDGCFKFLCPVCGEFNASVKYEINLARCFICRRNFNTIELVISNKKLTFVESVKYLQKYYASISKAPFNQGKTKKINDDISRISQDTDVRSTPTKIGKILSDILPRKSSNDPGCGKKSIPSKTDPSRYDLIALVNRVHWLEQEVENLTAQIKKIKSVIIQ